MTDSHSVKLVKREKDFTEIVDKELPACQELAKEGKVKEALENLLSLEKQTRMAVDALSTGRVLKAVVQLCFDTQDWEGLNEHIVLLTKRRSQLKTAMAAMVEECCKFVDQTPNLTVKLSLIDTLRTVTEGKIYVEVPRARLTMELARIKEERGEISEAANILQELQVETFGSMEKEEKVKFILEQMRLCMIKKDFIRTYIISKKISIKFFTDKSNSVQDLKLKYYDLVIELCQHDRKYLTICHHFREILDTPKIQADEAHWKLALKNVVLYVLLAPFDNDQSDLMCRVYEEKKLQNLPVYKEVLECFRREELLDWVWFDSTFAPCLRDGVTDGPATSVFSRSHDVNEAEVRWGDFRKRVIEHNIRVVAKYYRRINMSRLSELLALSVDECEDFISQLVTKKTIFARIDRPAQVVNFRQIKDPSEVLDDWSNNLSSLMNLVGKTTHLINKEEMVHSLIK